MDFKLTPEQLEFKDSVTRFARRHLADGARARAHEPAYPWDVAKLMADNGLLGMTEPEAGSAVTDLATPATPEGDGFRINGSKVFTTHAWYADLIVA